MKQYQAIVTCSQDPCSYCHAPRRSEPQKLLKDTYEEALAYGRAMSNNVYGASTHTVTVEVRDVGEWEPVSDVIVRGGWMGTTS